MPHSTSVVILMASCIAAACAKPLFDYKAACGHEEILATGLFSFCCLSGLGITTVSLEPDMRRFPAKMKVKRQIVSPPRGIFSADEMIALLNDFGIQTPKSTRVSHEDLVNKLEQVFDYAQLLDYFYPYLKKWDEVPLMPFGNIIVTDDREQHNTLGPAQTAMEAGMVAETSLHDSIRRNMMEDFFTVDNTVFGVAVTMNWLARLWDMGKTCCVIIDKEYKRRWSIPIRILSVRETELGVPIIMVLFCFISPRYNCDVCVPWINDKFPSGQDDSIRCILASVLEAELFLKLLISNSRYTPNALLSARDRTEKKFDLSFLVPMAPLSFDDINELRPGNVCVICEKKATRRCSGCDCVPYCSRVCQRTHGKEHKEMCQSLKGATWHTVRFANAADLKGDMSGAHTDPEPDIHTDNAFVLHVSDPTGDGGALHIQDRFQSIRAWLREKDSPDVVRKLRNDLETLVPDSGSGKPTIYRWARRVGEWELEVCCDREVSSDADIVRKGKVV